MQKTFDYYRSTNKRLAASLDQQDNYERYLKRVQNIVNKKPHIDFSTTQYMGFLNKCRQISRNHRSHEQLSQITTNNQILLEKIVQAKRKRPQKIQDRYMLALHEKRFRELEKINDENKRIALRVIQKGSTLDLHSNYWSPNRQSPKRITEKTFYESRVKQRKLPKLVHLHN